MPELVADLKPRGVKPPLNLVPLALLRLYACTVDQTDQGLYAKVPRQLLEACAAAFHNGALKYEPWNWLHQSDMADMRETYTGALLRHIHAYVGGETRAPDSGVHHLGHAAACAAILGHHLGLVEAVTQLIDLADGDAEYLKSQLVHAAHGFADMASTKYDAPDLAMVVRCLGDLAVLDDVGYDEPSNAKAARQGRVDVRDPRLRDPRLFDVELTLPDGDVRVVAAFESSDGGLQVLGDQGLLESAVSAVRPLTGKVYKGSAPSPALPTPVVLHHVGPVGSSSECDANHAAGSCPAETCTRRDTTATTGNNTRVLVVSYALPVGDYAGVWDSVTLCVRRPGSDVAEERFDRAELVAKLSTASHIMWWHTVSTRIAG